jgi:exopolyphosphatase/guanosine-5'-triphosphate,3'-diphosphate pyrophosphatase
VPVSARPPADPYRKPVAVIDIGSTSIRMAIADIDPEGRITPYETLIQSLSLGDDTFTRGDISPETTRACIQILKSFRRVMAEYHIPDENVRAVATSAVREAANRQIFLDRLYLSTGIAVEALDDADTTRLLYLSVLPFLDRRADFRRSHTLVVEVGGGLTEVLALHGQDIVLSRVFRLGARRLRELVREESGERRRAALTPHILRVVHELRSAMPPVGPVNLVLLGGDIRFAAAHFGQPAPSGRLSRLRTRLLDQLTKDILSLPEDEVVRRHRLPFADAETLGPALLCNLLLARAFGVNVIRISSITLRDGLLREMAARGRWSEEFSRQIVRSAIELGRRYRFDEAHGRNVALACRMLFAQLQPEHQLSPRFGVLLEIAALLHEVGLFISSRSHHKHSQYIIQNSDLFGLSPRDALLVALVARYHRRSHPKPTHLPYGELPRDERIVVSKLAALLRVADTICRQRGRPAPSFDVVRDESVVRLDLHTPADLTLEQQALEEKGALFEEVFGCSLALRRQGQPGS